ncbi:MAG TPA: CHASE domain-containing protein [Methylibium sp.]|uniref:CHASE domain-containing protein n=1 Tax=Methylibium sp. TaxID=2067992 RepID=UPI002DBAAFF9|nr:CHASE domain-containing protein [Methylibium sp.]HEU4457975.1 CHASE domain-containing protein [Methylibium sp.]
MSDAPTTILEADAPTPRARAALAPLAMVALAYAAVGIASVQLSIGDVSASPLFPSAGIALAAVLVYGRQALLAVYAGSLAVQAFVVATLPTGGAFAWLVAAAIPLGAVAQAALGDALVRRSVPGPLTLDGPKSITRLFLLGGALACTVSASWATMLLGSSGAIPLERLAAAWATWWGGDTLGVVIAVPAVLTLIGRPRRAWRPRRNTVGLPLTVATAMLALAIGQIERVEADRTQTRFERDAGELARTVRLRLESTLNALDAVHGVFIGSSEVDRREFERATASWLAKLPGLQALGWHEWVARDRIAELVARVRADGDPYYRVFEREPVLSAQDTESLVLRFIEPRAHNEAALGVNAMSIPAARTAALKARELDAAVATRGFRLTQDTGEQFGVVVYKPVFDGDGAQRRLRGMVFATLRMDDALARFLAAAPGYLESCLLETAEGAAPVRLAGAADCRGDAARERYVHREKLGFAGREWTMLVRAKGEVPAAARAGILGGDNSAAWMFSLTGLAATGLMGALLLLVTGRERLTRTAIEKATQRLQREIADRQLTERALRESEGRFRSMFKTVPVGMLYTELNGRIKQVNSAICHLTGYSEEELLSLSMATLTHHDDRDLDDERRRDLIAGRRSMHRLRMRYVAKNGEERWVRSTVTVMRNAQGQPHRLVALVEDIREHLRLEEAEKARETAESANAAKNEFLSRMSHELRTPLNAMLGFAQLLELDRSETLHERHRGWIGQIQQAGWHLLEMINDVLDLSRIESGTLSLQVEPLQAEPLIAASLALVEPQARSRGIHLVRAMADHGPLRWIADATRVKQILTNLLSNAVKYNRDGGEVRVATRRVQHGDAAFLELDVIDTGIGIDADQLAQLFQPFNRLGREKGGPEGTGIGLVIARLLAERQGGSLTVKSEPGIGSVFTLRLPLHDEVPADSTVHSLADGLDAGYNGRHVLYVEDNETNVEVMRGIFGLRPQVRLSVATNGHDGLQAVREEHPDLVLLDMHLPDLDGMALLERLKADAATAEVPVIVVSADALPAQVQAAQRAGAVRYLTKPVAIDEMLDVLDEQLGKLTTRFG